MMQQNGAPRRYRRIAISAAAVATLTAGLSVAGTAAASASQTPARCGPSNATVHLGGASRNLYICGVGTLNTTGSGPYTLLEKSTHNRVWLHQHANGTGWADCFWADDVDIVLRGRDQNPGNVQVSSNTASC
jgi:hypothetical protein